MIIAACSCMSILCQKGTPGPLFMQLNPSYRPLDCRFVTMSITCVCFDLFKTIGFWRTHHVGTDGVDPQWKQMLQEFKVIRVVTFSPDCSLALISFHRRAVGVWSTSDNTLIKFLTSQHPDRVFGGPFVHDTLTTSVTASNNNCYIFAGFADMAATVWKLDSGEVIF